MKRYWFRRKRYGWGWYPATKEGWISMLLAIVALIANAYWFDTFTDGSNGDVILFSATQVLLVVALIALCYLTGEKPRWQWGKEKDDHDA